MGMYEPSGKIKAPVRGTVTSGQTVTVTLSAANVDFMQVERSASSAGTLRFTGADGAADIATAYYELTAFQPLTGWIPVADRELTFSAVGGDVAYCIWQVGR